MPIKNREARRAYHRTWMRNRRQEFFRGKACAKCGAQEGLELDHIDPKLKVTHAIWSWREDRRNEELAKCQVLCSACHKVKTRAQLEQTEHGSTKYRNGCRCAVCTEAQRVRVARQRGRS